MEIWRNITLLQPLSGSGWSVLGGSESCHYNAQFTQSSYCFCFMYFLSMLLYRSMFYFHLVMVTLSHKHASFRVSVFGANKRHHDRLRFLCISLKLNTHRILPRPPVPVQYAYSLLLPHLLSIMSLICSLLQIIQASNVYHPYTRLLPLLLPQLRCHTLLRRFCTLSTVSTQV